MCSNAVQPLRAIFNHDYLAATEQTVGRQDPICGTQRLGADAAILADPNVCNRGCTIRGETSPMDSQRHLSGDLSTSVDGVSLMPTVRNQRVIHARESHRVSIKT